MSRQHPTAGRRRPPLLQRAWDDRGRICDWSPFYLDMAARLVAREPSLPHAIRAAQAQVDNRVGGR